MRLSIEVTSEQHARLKAVAALHQLEELLRPRIEAARWGEFVSKSVEQIFEEVHHEALDQV